jgi:DNA-binding beta-propeller fold protein YncE
MTCRSLIQATVLVLVACMSGAQAADTPPLMLEATVSLEHTRGRIDHMAVDLRRKRLFVAELGNGSVDVIDLATSKVAARLDRLKEPQGIGYAESADLVVVASAGDGSVRFYRGADLSAAGTLSLGDDADNVRIDVRRGRVVVGYGTGGLAVIDPVARAKVADLPVPGHPEGFQLGPAGDRAFVNVPDAKQVAIVDLGGTKPATAWRIPGPLGNFPMAYDADRRQVVIVTRNPPELLLLNGDTGTVMARQTACGDADDVFLDPKRQRIYVSCGGGEVATWRRDGAGLQKLASTPTQSGARTSLFVPALDRLFVARPAGLLGSTAAVLVLRPQDDPNK